MTAHMPGPSAPCNSLVGTFGLLEKYQMNEIQESLNKLFNRIPRRHTSDNVEAIYSIVDEYEDLLKTMETDARYKEQVARLFDALDPIRVTIRKSNDGKASKKAKDVLFDAASGALKDTVEAAMQL
jgi:hypothetical protein